MKYLFASLFVLAPLALAAPYPHSSVDVVLLETRQDCNVTCGNTCYSSDQIQDALSAGYDDYSNGQEVHSYPHQYNDYEGFSFPVSGPYQEFPIKTSGAYTGGSPGADRIVFNENGDFAGLITHTGASGNNFVGCSDTS